MNLLFMFMGTLRLAEGIDLSTGNDLLMPAGPTERENYGLDEVYGAGKWIFLINVACSLGVDMNRLPGQVEIALLVPFAATLAAHVYVFKSKKFRKGS